MLLSIRFSLPDRPGMLGSVATALSHTGASIVQLVVVEREGGFAVDEACLELEDGMPPEQLRRATESIPGVVVEAIRAVDSPPDPLAALELADRLSMRSADPVRTLVSGLPDALPAAWAMALSVVDEVAVIESTPGAPPPGVMDTPWLPLDGARRLDPADWMPPRWRNSRLELAAAPLIGSGTCVLAGRRAGMRFRPSELRRLEVLAAMAARAAEPAAYAIV